MDIGILLYYIRPGFNFSPSINFGLWYGYWYIIILYTAGFQFFTVNKFWVMIWILVYYYIIYNVMVHWYGMDLKKNEQWMSNVDVRNYLPKSLHTCCFPRVAILCSWSPCFCSLSLYNLLFLSGFQHPHNHIHLLLLVLLQAPSTFRGSLPRLAKKTSSHISNK